MERSEQTGLAVAVVGHVVVFGLLSATFLAKPDMMKIVPPQPIDISMVDEVGLTATAPQSETPPALSEAPETGVPEDAPPPAPEQTVPEAKPKAEPVKSDQPPPKPVVAPTPPAKPLPTKATGKQASSPTARPRGSRLGPDFLKGLADKPSTSTSPTPRAAVIDARALAGIQDAIRRQIQPCADRQVNPGPGANQIVTTFNLRLNPDGTLAATPTVIRQAGTDGEGGRYSKRVIDLGIAALTGCSPLKLPPEFYATPAGGWNNINYNWQLR